MTTNVVMWIAPLGGGNVNYHQYDNSPNIIIIIIIVIVIIKNNINYYFFIINYYYYQ